MMVSRHYRKSRHSDEATTYSSTPGLPIEARQRQCAGRSRPAQNHSRGLREPREMKSKDEVKRNGSRSGLVRRPRRMRECKKGRDDDPASQRG